MLLRRLWDHGDRLALVAADGTSFTYRELVRRACHVAEGLRQQLHQSGGTWRSDIAGDTVDAASLPAAGAMAVAASTSSPIAIFATYDPSFVWGALGIWGANGIVTPIHNKYPPREIEYILRDTGAPVVLTNRPLFEKIRGTAAECGAAVTVLPGVHDAFGCDDSPDRPPSLAEEESRSLKDPALILYTSGTTGRPKGVLHTHGSVTAMVESLVEAWEWQETDRILHFLPLHHVHGLVNKLLCALHAGATVEFTGGASSEVLWRRLQRAGEQQQPVAPAREETGAMALATAAAAAEPATEAAAAAAALPASSPDGSQLGSANVASSSGGAGIATAAEPAAPPVAAAAAAAAADAPPTLFMAVPTIYARLLEAAESGALPPAELAAARRGLAGLRLTVSGSAALPDSLAARWRRLSGHTMLERYGMTEIGMALSNPLRPEDRRLPGFVGQPLPGVAVRIVAEDSADGETNSRHGSGGSSAGGKGGGAGAGGGDDVARGSSDAGAAGGASSPGAVAAPAGAAAPPGVEGELRVKGPLLFCKYWNRPDATVEAFDAGGWFRTGDVAVFDAAADAYRIVGRASADIIKTGGYKVSALDVERTLLEHPAVAEVAVLGAPDPVFGQRVCAVVRRRPKPNGCGNSGGGGGRNGGGGVGEAGGGGGNGGSGGSGFDGRMELELPTLRRWLGDRLADYKQPTLLVVLPPGSEVPKNAMGKVNKKTLLEAAQAIAGAVEASL